MNSSSPPVVVGLVEGGSGSGAAAADRRGFSVPVIEDDWWEAIRLFLQTRRSAGTRRVYRFTLWEFIAFTHHKPFSDISRMDVLAYSVWMRERGLANQTVNSRISVVSSFFKFAQGEMELGGRNPALTRAARVKVNPYSSSNYLGAEELRALIGAIDRKSAQGKRDYALFLFMIASGRRVSEAVRLRWNDFDESDDGRVWYHWSGKGGKEGWNECPGIVWQALGEWRAAQRMEIGAREIVFTALAANGVYFPNVDPDWRPGTRGLTSSTVGYLLHRYAGKAGLKDDIRVHTLRHSAAMLRRQVGDDVETIQRFLAHSNLAVTQIYLHQLERAVDRSWVKVAEVLGLG